MPELYDIFFSYRRHDLPRAEAFLAALQSLGLRVWRDQTDIPDAAPITQNIRDGIAASKLFVAFYSVTYPLSNPCQQELIAAWLAAQHLTGAPTARIRIVNPEPAFDHIPELLQDQQSPPWPVDESGRAAITQRIADQAATLTEPLAAATSPMPPCFGLSPIHSPRFVGRVRQLWDLHGKLTANRIGVITGVYGQAATQVRGLGGNGKSLLAREYAIRFGRAYPGGIFWINAYGNDDSSGPLDADSREASRQDQICDFAIRLGLPIDGRKPAEIETVFWRHLEERAQPCLWIVDDLPSGLGLPQIERTWNARWPGASTLITTRSGEYDSLGAHLDLPVLSPAEAWDLLTRHRLPLSEKAAARGIVELLGHHPQAIEVAGSYLALGAQTFEQYHNDLQDPDHDALELGALLRESLPTGHDRSISRTLLKSVAHLGPEGLDFLRLASVLAVAPIPVSLVQNVFASDGGYLIKALDQTESLSLCEKVGHDARSVHTLISRTMRFHRGQDDRTLQLRAAAVEALHDQLSGIDDLRELPKVASELAHARHLVSMRMETTGEAALGTAIAHHDFQRGEYPAARKLQEQVWAVLRLLLGEEHHDMLMAIHNLAATLLAQGDLARARTLQEQVLEANERLLGYDHPDTITATHNLSSTLFVQGDLAGARRRQEWVWDMYRRTLGAEHPATLTAINNLANTLEALGDTPGAQKLQEQALEAMRRVLGEEHPSTLTAISNLALTLYSQGALERAQRLQEQILEARRRLLGEEHPATLTAMNNLGLTLNDQGDSASARKLHEKVLEARLRLQGDRHFDTLTTVNNLAQALQAQGDLAAARKLYDQVIEARRLLLGEEHPATLSAIANLAVLQYQQGDLSSARKLQEQGLEASRRLLGTEHPDTLLAINNLSITLSAQGDFAQGQKLQEQLLEVSIRVLGSDHPDTLTVMMNLGTTLFKQGHLLGARKAQERALAGIRRLLGEEHPDTLSAMEHLAGTLRAQSNLASARKLDEQVQEIRRRADAHNKG